MNFDKLIREESYLRHIKDDRCLLSKKEKQEIATKKRLLTNQKKRIK